MIDLLELGISEALLDRQATESAQLSKRTLTNYEEEKFVQTQSISTETDIAPQRQATVGPIEDTSVSYKGTQPTISFAKSEVSLSGRPSTSQALQVLRFHYGERMLKYLNFIHPVAGTLEMEFFVAGLFRTIRQMRDDCPDEPLTDVALALYDSLVFEKRWAQFTSEQYEKVEGIITWFVSHKKPSYDDIKKAILRLEEAGFDTTPYNLGVEVECPAQ